MPSRIVAGASVAFAIAGAAWRARALTATGAVAAVVVGTAAVAGGWAWGAMLVFFFVSSTALSRAGSAAKVRAAAGRIAKPGARDAVQVFANGGVFAAGAVASLAWPSGVVIAAAFGALASATADTWATEVGMLSPAKPRSIASLQRVDAGESGGVTMLGTFAGVAGAGAVAVGVAFFGVPDAAPIAILLGGVAGLFADSLLGATLQAQRRCPVCHAMTERARHTCGNATQLARGRSWLDNDGVNALATGAGAAVAAIAAWQWAA